MGYWQRLCSEWSAAMELRSIHGSLADERVRLARRKLRSELKREKSKFYTRHLRQRATA